MHTFALAINSGQVEWGEVGSSNFVGKENEGSLKTSEEGQTARSQEIWRRLKMKEAGKQVHHLPRQQRGP